MQTYIAHNGRDLCSLFHCILAYALLIFIIPAIISSCTGLAEKEKDFGNEAAVSVTMNVPAGSLHGGNLDIFIFNNDRLRRLDSYQRTSGEPGETVRAASRKGSKIIVAIANSKAAIYEWENINSYESLQKVRSNLRDEDPSSPVMFGEAVIEAGQKAVADIEMSPLLSEIFISSIRCDFSGKPYAGAAMENVRIYLTHANSNCEIMRKKDFVPESPLNVSGLHEEDLKDFLCPEMLLYEIRDGIRDGGEARDISLFTYPNDCNEESIGAMFTKLVIECKIRGETYYYPIDINRQRTVYSGTGDGIGRNCRYRFGLTVKMTGSTDPDICVDPGTVYIESIVEDWDEKDDERIPFYTNLLMTKS